MRLCKDGLLVNAWKVGETSVSGAVAQEKCSTTSTARKEDPSIPPSLQTFQRISLIEIPPSATRTTSFYVQKSFVLPSHSTFDTSCRMFVSATIFISTLANSSRVVSSVLTLAIKMP